MSDTICIDDTSRFQEAAGLYDDAAEFVDSAVGGMKRKPLAIFCATEACYQSFGSGRSAAQTIATFGIAISPRGWKPHYVRHEMIHHLQRERLGTLKSWLITPEWLTEGMAYSLRAPNKMRNRYRVRPTHRLIFRCAGRTLRFGVECEVILLGTFSGNPRQSLAEPWQQYRAEFDTWYKKVGKERLWVEASAL
jgi:hypothetical protein